jgi:predicted Zn-ribbon and HTH transcriptional regulator
MRIKKDILSQKILEMLKKVDEPLETIEVLDMIKNSTRVKILYRLNRLRGETVIKGKQVGSGKGTWIWWKDG